MGQEDDSNEPPDEVPASILIQRWDRRQTQRVVVDMGSYVVLVLSEVELDTGHNGRGVTNADGQGIECLNQSRHGMQIGLLQRQNPGVALGQHLSDALAELSPSLSRFEHLHTKILPVEDEAIEQERRDNITTAVLTLVSSDSEYRDAAAGRTSLKRHGRIELLTT